MTTALLNGSGKFSFHIFSTEFYENDIKNIQKTAREFACNIFYIMLMAIISNFAMILVNFPMLLIIG